MANRMLDSNANDRTSPLAADFGPTLVIPQLMIAFIRCVWLLAILGATLLAADIASAQLPSESVLPTQSAPAGGSLPSEAELPSGNAPDASAVDDVGEALLPGPAAIQRAPGDDAAADDVSGDDRPRLRLALDGHIAQIRAVVTGGDGQWMASAGEDKDVHVWSPRDSTTSGWFHRRIIRWQVNRAQRGRIYALASRGDEVALGGYGAMGGNGEIWIVDVHSGNLLHTLVDTTDGHRQVIVSLAWAPDGSSRLLSADLSGKIILWTADPNTGLWSHRTIIEADRSVYGNEWGDVLQRYRVTAPVAWLGENSVAVPKLVGQTPPPNGAPLWKVAKVDLDAATETTVPAHQFQWAPLTLTTSASANRMVTSDRVGETFVLRFAVDGSVSSGERIETKGSAISHAISSDAKRLFVGTFASPSNDVGARSTLQCWDIDSNPARRLSSIPLSAAPVSIALNESLRQVIVVQASRLDVYNVSESGELATPARAALSSSATPMFDVRFRSDKDSYGIDVDVAPELSSGPPLRYAFDLRDVRLLPTSDRDEGSLVPRQRLSQKWDVREITTDAGVRWQLHRDNEAAGVLPLQPESDGAPTAVATLAVVDDELTRSGEVVFVGTSGENNIYAYQADGANPPRLLRQFRGHSSPIRALATSADGRYLASASLDATIGVWKLDDLFSATENENRWGVDFELQGDRLVAANVRDDGPLFFRGVRGGDRLLGIKWTNQQGTETFAESDPSKMLSQLQSLPFNMQVTFDFSRMGRPLAGFQSFPAWQPLATLFIDNSREWAFWTPAGFYNASINGHQRFGWQINRGVSRLPEYFRAAQFRESLERPEVMRRLLETGSLPRAMQSSLGALGPPPGEEAIVNLYKNKPRIELQSPKPGAILVGSELDVVAKITVPMGATLAGPKAFISGVPAVAVELVSEESTSMQSVATYRWKMRLPSEPQLKLELVAATEALAVDRVVIDFEHQFETSTRRPRMHVIAFGVSEYRDRQIQSLDFAARATDVIANLFRKSSQPLYRVTTDQLIDRDATRPMWRVFASQAAEELSKTVSPDDLVVMYLCGHGLRDRLTGQWYFVTADARYRDLMNDQYDDCLSFGDLAALSALPCRKLAILDSCHSGAVQTMMRCDDLKSALRFLQDDVVLTITASEGDQEAAEERESKLGRFTSEWVDGLSGQADREGNSDGIVTLRETIDFVTRRVTEASEKEGAPQYPTASPEYLIESVDLPLATAQ